MPFSKYLNLCQDNYRRFNYFSNDLKEFIDKNACFIHVKVYTIQVQFIHKIGCLNTFIVRIVESNRY